MMKLQKYLYVCAVCMAISSDANSQLTIQPQVPQAGLVQKSQLWNMTASYLATDNPSVIVEIQVVDRNTGQTFLTGNSSAVQLKNGVQLFTELSLGPVTYLYANPSGAGSSGLLPAGIYQVCYQVTTADQKTEKLAEECLPVDVEAMSPPILVQPEDSAELSIQYPQFTWLPPTPISIFPDLKYDLIVTEILPNQTPMEAIERNMPVYSQSGITSSMSVYPSSAPLLDTGRFYAWQIIAMNGYSYGAKSDVWVFSVSKPSPNPVSVSSVFYPRLSKKIYDAVYTAGPSIKFEFINENNETSAQLRIQQVKQDGKVLLDQKSIQLSPGQNYISWDAALPKKESKEQTIILLLLLPTGGEWGCLFRIPAAK